MLCGMQEDRPTSDMITVNSTNPGIAHRLPFDDKSRDELVEMVLQAEKGEQFAKEALVVREEQLQRLMEEFNPGLNGDDMSTLRWENSSLRKQIGIMETEILRLNDNLSELKKGAQSAQNKMTGFQNAAKVAEEKAGELSSQMEVQRLVNMSLSSMVSSPGGNTQRMGGGELNLNNELLPAQRVGWVDRLYKVLLDVDTDTGVDLDLVKRTLLMHDPGLNWDAMLSIMGHVREGASRGSIGLGDFYWWVVVALQGAQQSDAAFVESMRHLVLGTCRTVIGSAMFGAETDDGAAGESCISDRSAEGYVDAVLDCFKRIARGDVHTGVPYWVLQGGVHMVPQLPEALFHPDTGRELEACDGIGLSLFSRWVAGCLHEPITTEQAAASEEPGEEVCPAALGAQVSLAEFQSSIDLVLASAMGSIVKGPTRGEDGQVICPLTGPVVTQETPECYEKLLKVARSEAPKVAWEVKHEDQQIVVESLDRKVVLVRAVLQMKGISPDLALEVLLDTTVRTKWDPVLEFCKGLPCSGAIEDENYSFDFDVETIYVYMKIKKQMGVKARDCCQRWKVCRDDCTTGAHLVLIEDAKHQDAPLNSSFVRMSTVIGGYLLAPDGEGGCVMTIINQTDVNGNVPTSMVNAFAVKAPVIWQNKVIRACQKRKSGKL
eukprot:TRINITY_DN44030_c0_g1_i1.p1 TRINITY_DN44030_c0_g1~~TRINITY_DN44030_c0_g1_i1.p1  ORF type:complete len:661 (-),score=142.95 TRINITY_DN44030_c0_g1_i1:191-2173(-)